MLQVIGNNTLTRFMPQPQINNQQQLQL